VACGQSPSTLWPTSSSNSSPEGPGHELTPPASQPK
jgi:hypothetical protein